MNDLRPLFDAMLDESITPDDFATLTARLRDDADARIAWADYLHLHTALLCEHTQPMRVQGSGGSGFWVQDRGQETGDRGQTLTPTLSLRSVWYIAAAALIALAATAWFLLAPEPRTLNPEPSVATQSVAMLSDLSDDAVFAETSGDGPMTPGTDLPPGPIRLTAGKAQIMFASDAVVDLTGPCEFEMIGENRGKLTSGTLEAYVPKKARGFTVDLPDGATIVDLGTRFHVEVLPNGVTTRVLEGSVAITDKTGATRRLAQGVSQVLMTGRFTDPGAKHHTAYDRAVLADGPVAYWKLDGLAEDGRFADVAGGHHAKPVGPAEVVADSAFGGDVVHVAPGGHVTVAGHDTRIDAFAGTRQFTLTGWLRPDLASGRGSLFLAAQGDRRAGWSLMYMPGDSGGPGHLVFNHYAVGEMRFYQAAIPVVRWSHFALVCAPDRVTMYLDGKAIQSVTPAAKAPPMRSSFYVRLGAVADANGWSGSMARMAYYDKPLSADQIRDHLAAIQGAGYTLSRHALEKTRDPR